MKSSEQLSTLWTAEGQEPPQSMSSLTVTDIVRRAYRYAGAHTRLNHILSGHYTTQLTQLDEAVIIIFYLYFLCNFKYSPA